MLRRQSVFKLHNYFSFKTTSPRKYVSQSKIQYSSQEMARELGPKCTSVDLRIGDEKFVFDPVQGEWLSDERQVDVTVIDSLNSEKFQLEAENNALREKLEILLQMLAEVCAEEELRT